MPTLIPETAKKPGVCYAFTAGGVELPVIDITHPAFHQELGEEQLAAAAERFARQEAAKGPLARWLQRHLLPFFLKRSIIGRGLLRSRGGYLDGMSTYLMKLGPQNLGAWASDMDRKLVEGMNRAGLSLGQRLQDMAESIAAGLRPALAAEPQRPLHLINIAGGPSMDSLNALILLAKEGLLTGRSLRLSILDLESDGSRFAAAALAALQGPEGPLRGHSIALDLKPYDWNEAEPLIALLQSLEPGALAALSSEGGLFDYGDDAAIGAHLEALQAHSPGDTLVVASLSPPHTRPGGPFARNGIAKVVQRSFDDLNALAAPRGWKIVARRSRPISLVARLRKTSLD